MTKENGKPQIRFAGFDDAWEQRKLGDIFKEYSEKNHEELPPLTIIQGGGTIRRDQSDRNLQFDKSNLSNYKMVKKNDFIVHLRSFEGGLEKANSDGIISPAYHTLHGEEADSRFYYPYFRSHKFINIKLTPHVYGVRDGRSIDISGMKTIDIPYTSLEEQKRIGDFIEEFDNLITLQQRKLDHLKEQKKGLLQKMFPKKGEKVPEIRFPGFTDDWEMRKLGEITQIKTGSSDLQDAVEDGKYPFFVRSENIEHSNRYIFEGEAILIPGEGRLGEIYHYINGKFDYHQRVYKISNFADSNTNGKYILYFMEKNFKQHALKFTVKATVDSLRLPMLTEFNILLPSLSEQEKISVFFTSFDNLITLHQRKLDHLKEQKKGLLQQMFV